MSRTRTPPSSNVWRVQTGGCVVTWENLGNRRLGLRCFFTGHCNTGMMCGLPSEKSNCSWDVLEINSIIYILWTSQNRAAWELWQLLRCKAASEHVDLKGGRRKGSSMLFWGVLAPHPPLEKDYVLLPRSSPGQRYSPVNQGVCSSKQIRKICLAVANLLGCDLYTTKFQLIPTQWFASIRTLRSVFPPRFTITDLMTKHRTGSRLLAWSSFSLDLVG